MANASSKLQCSSLVVVFFCFVVAFNLIVVMYRVMVSVKKQFSYSTSLQGLATKKTSWTDRPGKKSLHSFSFRGKRHISRIESGIKCCCMANQASVFALCNYQTRKTMLDHISKTTRRELKIRRVAEYFFDELRTAGGN